MAQIFKETKSIPSLDVLLNDLKVGTIVRTPGDFNAFSFDEAYRATGGFPVLSLSFRAATGGLRKEKTSTAPASPRISMVRGCGTVTTSSSATARWRSGFMPPDIWRMSPAWST